MSSLIRNIFFAIFMVLFISTIAYGDDNKNDNQQEQPPHIENFSFPVSQQPGPFISFGQNVLEKNQFQLNLYGEKIVGIGQHYINFFPILTYQMTDRTSLALSIPVAVDYRHNNHHSAGLEDSIVQLENVFYTKTTAHFADQATIVTNVTLPTGSSQKNPTTGYDSPSLFLGLTFSRMYSDWFGFISPGGILTTERNNTKFGNSLFYQLGLGRNIATIESKWLIAWLIEANGEYTQKNRINGAIDPDSGGNIIYITPSLWISSKKIIFQFGVGAPITQNLYGNQQRQTYFVAGNIGWTLNS